MDKIDKIIQMIQPSDICELLEVDNPYLGKPFRELLDMMAPDGDAPEEGTRANDFFQYALLTAYRERCRLSAPDPVPPAGILRGTQPVHETETEARSTPPDPMEAYRRLYCSDQDRKPDYLR